jgi:DNA-binding XRE family transcriptional regulator
VTAAIDDGDDLARVGRAVAARRVELGIDSQAALAEKAGVGLSTAAQLERGQVWPRKNTAHKIEAALQWPAGALHALRRGAPIPQPASDAPSMPVLSTPAAAVHGQVSSQTLAITVSLVQIAAAVVDHLALLPDKSAARSLTEAINGDLLNLEAQLTGILPDLRGESFDDGMSTVEELHRRRVALESILHRSDG